MYVSSEKNKIRRINLRYHKSKTGKKNGQVHKQESLFQQHRTAATSPKKGQQASTKLVKKKSKYLPH